MQIIADLHIHSKFSRAVSPKMDLPEIASWADKKGIQLMGTGDWTHPTWFQHIKNTLEETTSGIYKIKGRNYNARFLLSVEISSIYSQGGQGRRIHNLIFSPSIATCEKINFALQKRNCNLRSDGRPIIGLSSKELLEVIMEIDEKCLLIPAHIWTPWFALFGSKSGFTSIKECFGNLDKYIYGVETGLSSDPIMNWQIAELDNRSILSSSDAHSGPKIGREATVFVPTMKQFNPLRQSSNEVNNLTISFTYQDIVDAIKQNPNGKLKIGYTIEFFPEEGKYHWSGHRACNIKYTPDDVVKNGKTCPVCHQTLTIGVENQIRDRSTRIITVDKLRLIKNSAGMTFVYDPEKKRRPFVSLVPLLEVLTEINEGSATKALEKYNRLVNIASEFDILLRKPCAEINTLGGEKLAQAIQIIRNRKVYINPGYDGVFGTVKIFNEPVDSNKTELTSVEEKQPTLFKLT